MEAPRIEESMDDRQGIRSYGQRNLGVFADCCSYCTHITREDVVGVGISRLLSNMTIGLSTEQRNILTSLKPGASLCVGHVTMPSAKGRCCVLDAEGKVIIALRVKFALTAETIRNFFYSGKIKESESEIPLIIVSTEEHIQRK